MMNRFWLASILVFGIAHLPLAAQIPPAIPAINQRMEAFMASGDISGAVTVVGRSSGVIHLGAVGSRNLATNEPMTPDTLFRIASMTKPITAIGIMILADRGKLSPSDLVEKHLPEFKGQMLVDKRDKESLTLKKPSRPITLADLLTHTSGLAAYPPGMADVYTKRNRTLAETTAAVSQMPLNFEPGTKWAYSNSGIDTLGRVIEVVSGERYETFLQKNVFDPLGMTNTHFFPTQAHLKMLAVTYAKKDGKLEPTPPPLLVDLSRETKHPVPAGGLFSNATDLAQLYQMMLNHGQLNGKRILSEKAVHEMTQIHTRDINTGFVDGMSYGYGFAVVRQPSGVTEMMSPGTYGHGGAFGTQGWLDPKRDLFAILLIQRTGLSNGDASPMRKALQEEAVRTVPSK